MLTEIRGRSQITIPAEIIKKLGIAEGDRFDVIEKNGGIFLCPVAAYPKDKMAKIARIIKESEAGLLKKGGYDSVEDLFGEMDIDAGIDIYNV